ncbi:MAG: glycosyl transferase [Firmicutes bacterium]|nr:glycosyl transferase [Bacillota bacterium]
MQYGFFDDKNKEYVITTPNTPLPWINYLGNEAFFSLVSNTGGGYSFHRDAKLRRISRFRYNNVPDDGGGRMYYIKDGETIWSPAFLPSMTELDEYKCRHGMGYTILESAKNGIKSELMCFVPNGENCEINKLTIKNTSSVTKKISLYGAVEFCLWNAVDDASNFQRNFSIGEVEIEDKTIYHKTEYRERRNHFAFFGANVKHDGYDTDRAKFLGKFRSWQNAEIVASGKSNNNKASGWSPIACHRYDIELKAGEEKTIVFVLGYIENAKDNKWESKGIINKKQAHEMLARFDTASKVDAQVQILKAYWDKLLSNYKVTSDEPKLDRMVNIWNQYQCMVTFNMSRSASYFESGMGRGMGFRDSCQDLLGGIHLIPNDRTRQRIIDIASIQFEDGSTYHQYQPLTKRGNADVGGGFNDDPLWLIAATSAYIKETGDKTILDELVPFDNAPGSEKPLMEHLRRSFNHTTARLGPHGLPLIGRADWNDCLNLNCFSTEPGESFQTCANFESGVAESLFIAGQFVLYGKEYAELCRRFGYAKEAPIIEEAISKMEKAVLEHGWDGEWFLRAYDAFGTPIGSKANEEGKIFIESQGICTMAKIGGDKYGKKAIASVRKHLLNDFGCEILTPCFSEYHERLGEVSSYPPGYKENGAVFCHNNPWVVFACAAIGDGDGAYDLYVRNSPAFIEDKSEIHRTEPYVYSQMIAGRAAPNYGEAKNSWLTGTASWTMLAASQAILGIYPDYDGLKIAPCLPKSLKKINIIRKFRGVTYDITIINSGLKKAQLTVDGKRLSGAIVPFGKNSVIVVVECKM